jgi:DNA repair exonuclease SbcCD ATPase subunit
MDGTLEDRLAALERAVTDGKHDCSALAEGAATADRVDAIEAEIEDLTDRVAELEAATQALRGYVGNVRSVNSEVEERADLALSKAEAASRAVDGLTENDENGTSRTVSGQGEHQNPEHSSSSHRSTRNSPREVDPERERCAHCGRPFPEERSDGADSARPGMATAGSDSDPPGLDALREPTDTRSDELRAMAGAGTDGSRRSQTTDGNGSSLSETANRASDSGVISRVRSLL